MNNHCWKLSPSDLTFLWNECPRCFYLKIVRGFPRPRTRMPKIFNRIDAHMKECYTGRRVENLAYGAPSGVIEHGERWVESRPLSLPACASRCFIRGKFDTAARLDDHSHGIFDFKTCERKAEHLPLYARQLHAYAHAVEHPAPGRFSLSPVSTLGLLVFEPCRFDHGASGEVALTGSLTWIEILRDDEWFLDFLSGVVWVLEQPFPPDAAPSCEWCLFRETSRSTGF